MTVFELTHFPVRNHGGELFFTPKDLGIYVSYEDVQEAIRYYNTQPGFRDMPTGYCIRRRSVIGECDVQVVFEAMAYFHSSDYEEEYSRELGLFAEEAEARHSMDTFRQDNAELLASGEFENELLVNRRVIGRREWAEGFVVYTYTESEK